MTKIAQPESKWYWDDLISDWKEGRDQWREISREDYWNALETVPPVYQHGGDFLNGEPYSHTEEGRPVLGAFAEVSGGVGSRWFGKMVVGKGFREEFENLKKEVWGDARKIEQDKEEG